MRRTNTAFQIVEEPPTNGSVEGVQEALKSKESRPQHIPIGKIGAAPTGYVTPLTPISSPNQSLSGAGDLGAIDLDSSYTGISTTAAATATMAEGSVIGQLKTLRMVSYIADCVITVSGTGVTSVTLNSVDDVCTLMWLGAGWSVNDNFGCVIV